MQDSVRPLLSVNPIFKYMQVIINRRNKYILIVNIDESSNSRPIKNNDLYLQKDKRKPIFYSI